MGDLRSTWVRGQETRAQRLEREWETCGQLRGQRPAHRESETRARRPLLAFRKVTIEANLPQGTPRIEETTKSTKFTKAARKTPTRTRRHRLHLHFIVYFVPLVVS